MLKNFVRYVSFATLSMVGYSLFVLADTFFIAQGIGGHGIAALNLVLPVVHVISGLGWMFGVGGATLFTIQRSRGQVRRAQELFSLTALVAALVSLFIVAVCFFFRDPVLQALGASGELYHWARDYFAVYTLFTPAFILNFVMVSFLRNDGAPRLASIAFLAGGLANIVLDYIFIFPLQWGLAGAALATCFSPILSLVLAVGHLRREESQLKFRRFHFQWRDLVSVVANGLSSFMNEFSSAVVMFAFNQVLLSLAGDLGVTAYAIIANLNIIIIAILTGIGQGFQPLVSQFYGARDDCSVQAVFRLALVTYLVFGGLCLVIGQVGADPLVSIFNSQADPALAAMASSGLRLYFLSYPLTAVNFFVIYYAVAVNAPRSSMVVSLLRGLVLIVPYLLVMSRIWDLTGVWLTMTAVEASTALISIALIIYYYRRLTGEQSIKIFRRLRRRV
ncbi:MULTISPECIES: MATE family efflux transporter [Aerococcus]|uniref:Multidrug export protein MepA n=1 Tax=Aerococcus sanguinicola TaxID=119206 RepID=A0A5N1GLD6_9LACT|nr:MULTISPECIES: MATE family efflux transporter [Aerococcus]KAA9301214.1 MATE family efflux transporter [Aerococcus sanguinicola]MDK6369250.1 MATE family efflux transporter [Aerococcus sp. UMB9870]MDK6679073.1 MATE family efflux transporter [Aerococcus sp. UMB8608]MDK6940136.1 MATE family efflux transporter [Aerococcus sp. UMB8487]OFK19942.1 hypothetical protein HMPREF2829_06935 [Aerococcus sp. HMSC072A12]